jgi:serine/threonine-protein kinase
MSAGYTARLNAALEGRYRVEAQLGEGGMATVYLANDLRHGRKVALKVLKPELAAVVGAERFLAEIKTTASLQHPHILPLFDSGVADGLLFYVMPHVEGESLRDRLDRARQLPVDEAIRIATNVAEALDFAHRHGVIHRDIKPANILLLDGKPLIADFGIALAVSTGGAGRLTETGLSLGTPHYMSPEQATGDVSVGPATDIWALGCVLYEMLVGEPPYTGSTPQAVLGKIITAEQASASEARRSVPANVDAAIRKAMEKVPADRFGTAAELARALGDAGFRHREMAATVLGPPSRRWRAAALAGWSVAGALVGVVGWLGLRPDPAQPVTRFEVTLPEGLVVPRLGWDISPDGSTLVFAGTTGEVAEGMLYTRALDALVPEAIPGTEGVLGYPRFSPDGTAVAYFTVDNAIRIVSLDGTPPLTVVPDSAYYVRGLSWGEDRRIYFGKFAQASGLWRVGETGANVEEVDALAGLDLRFPDLLPGADGLLFSSGGQISVLSLSSGEVTALVPGRMARYAASGHLLITATDASGTLLAVPFDLDRLRVTGPPRTIMQGLQIDVSGRTDFAVSQRGDLVYRVGQSGPGEGVLVWLDRNAGTEVVAPELTGVIEAPAISPDGRRIAFDRTEGSRRDIWVYDLAAGTSSRITLDGEVNIRPEWSPDGREIGFVRQRPGPQAFYSVPSDGSGSPRLLRAPAAGSVIWEGLWTPDQRRVLFRELPRNNVGYLQYAAPHTDSALHAIVRQEYFNVAMSLSPDGRWLAYQSDESGQDEVYVRPFPGPGPQTVVSRGGGISPIWAATGDQIFFASGTDFVVATVRTTPSFAVESRAVFASTDGFYLARTIQRYDVSRDGEHILAIRDLSDAPSRQIVVQNFFEELARLAPN